MAKEEEIVEEEEVVVEEEAPPGKGMPTIGDEDYNSMSAIDDTATLDEGLDDDSADDTSAVTATSSEEDLQTTLDWQEDNPEVGEKAKSLFQRYEDSLNNIPKELLTQAAEIKAAAPRAVATAVGASTGGSKEGVSLRKVSDAAQSAESKGTLAAGKLKAQASQAESESAQKIMEGGATATAAQNVILENIATDIENMWMSALAPFVEDIYESDADEKKMYDEIHGNLKSYNHMFYGDYNNAKKFDGMIAGQPNPFTGEPITPEQLAYANAIAEAIQVAEDIKEDNYDSWDY